MNRLFALALALILLLSSAGCVGRAAAPEAESPTAPEPIRTETVPEDQTPPPPAESAAIPVPEEPYVRVIDPAKPMVALTFDDGPDESCSNAILDILEENRALATFFEVGVNVAACPEPVRRMAEMGCEIGSHSNAHKNLSKMKKSAVLRDLNAADQAFLDAGVDAPTLVRPPYGAVNKTVKSATGRAMITWTVDTLDWQSRDAQAVIDYVQSLESLDGEIVLLHSIYESTVQAVQVLVPWLQEQGYQLVTVSELMAYYYGELPQPNQFYGYTYFTTHDRTNEPVQLPGGAEDPQEPEAEEPARPPEEEPSEPASQPEDAPKADKLPAPSVSAQSTFNPALFNP